MTRYRVRTAAEVAQAAAEFQMTPGMESLVVTFLLKMSFVLTDGIKDPKDREAAALVKHNQILFSQALALWPRVRSPSHLWIQEICFFFDYPHVCHGSKVQRLGAKPYFQCTRCIPLLYEVPEDLIGFV